MSRKENNKYYNVQYKNVLSVIVIIYSFPENTSYYTELPTTVANKTSHFQSVLCLLSSDKLINHTVLYTLAYPNYPKIHRCILFKFADFVPYQRLNYFQILRKYYMVFNINNFKDLYFESKFHNLPKFDGGFWEPLQNTIKKCKNVLSGK